MIHPYILVRKCHLYSVKYKLHSLKTEEMDLISQHTPSFVCCKLILSNIKSHRGRKRERAEKKCCCIVQTIFSSVHNISICSCLCATETISSPAAVLAVLRSVLGRVGIMTRKEQGLMPGKKSIPQEIRCKPSSCCRETDLVCVCVSVFVCG